MRIALARAITAASADGSSTVDFSTTTSFAPLASASQIWSIDASNEYDDSRINASVARIAKSSFSASTRCTTLRCSTSTPLGWPVEPLV